MPLFRDLPLRARHRYATLRLTLCAPAQRVRSRKATNKGKTMQKFLTAVLIGAAFLVAPLSVLAADAPQGNAASAPGSEAADTKKALAQYRQSMQAARADVMAKGLTLSADQAAKFWPLFEQYQKEQNVIIDAQVAAIERYAEHYSTLTDADSIAFVKAQLDRRISQLAQAELSSKMPLVH